MPYVLPVGEDGEALRCFPIGRGVAGVHVEAVGAAVDLGDEFDKRAIESRLGDGVADGDLCALNGVGLLVDRDAGGCGFGHCRASGQSTR